MSKFFKNKATSVKKFLKVIVYGGPGTGKTSFALSFPEPGVVDMEHGTDFYATEFDFAVEHTKSAAKVIEMAEDVENNGGPGTFVIDPITLVWEGIQEAYQKKMEKKKGPDYEIQINDWSKVKRPHKRFTTTLMNMPCHVVLIAREGSVFEKKGNNFEEVGKKIDGEKSLSYVADIQLRLVVEPDGSRSGIVEKDRSNTFTVGHRLPIPWKGGFDAMKPFLDKLNGEATPDRTDGDADEQRDERIFDEAFREQQPVFLKRVERAREVLGDETVNRVIFGCGYTDPIEIPTVEEMTRVFVALTAESKKDSEPEGRSTKDIVADVKKKAAEKASEPPAHQDTDIPGGGDNDEDDVTDGDTESSEGDGSGTNL